MRKIVVAVLGIASLSFSCSGSEPPVKAEPAATAPASAEQTVASPPQTGNVPVVDKSDWEPLRIDLPKPMFVGTPRALMTPNLEAITGELREPFLAPKGLANLAYEAPVSGSDQIPIVGDLTQITDGDKEASDGSFVELHEGVQYVQIDLGAEREIFAVVVWHFHMEARVYFDVVVKTANDADFITDVKTVFNNDHDNSAGLGVGKQKEYIETNEGRLMDAGGVRGRFVRLYSNGNTSNSLNHYIEVEVYGKPE